VGVSCCITARSVVEGTDFLDFLLQSVAPLEDGTGPVTAATASMEKFPFTDVRFCVDARFYRYTCDANVYVICACTKDGFSS
jgi:hypothetical protein